MFRDSARAQKPQPSLWQSLWRHLTVKGLMLAAIALFLVTVSVDAFYHNAIAAEFSGALPSELSVAQTEALPTEADGPPSQQTMERLSHNGLTHGSLTRHHLTSAHLFTDM